MHVGIPEKTHGYYGYGIFDGHGGIGSALYGQQHLIPELSKALDEDENVDIATVGDFIAGFMGTFDEEIIEVHGDSGSTACVALVNRDFIVNINVGHSRCLVIGDQLMYASKDHKPVVPQERLRIVAAGGQVSAEGRISTDTVYGLDLSRSLGDAWYKAYSRNLVVSTPDVHVIKRSVDQKFILIASDGLYANKSNEEITHFISTKLSTDQEQVQCVCDDLVRYAYNPNDNCSVILVDLRPYGTMLSDSEEEVEEVDG